MILATTETIQGRKIVKTLGLVSGSSAKVPHFGKHVMAFFRHLVGGELKEYGDAVMAARKAALERMVAEAEELGADAVVCLRITNAGLSAKVNEVTVYGTAVRISVARNLLS